MASSSDPRQLTVEAVKAFEAEPGTEVIIPEFVGTLASNMDGDATQKKSGTRYLALEGGEGAELDRTSTVYVVARGSSPAPDSGQVVVEQVKVEEIEVGDRVLLCGDRILSVTESRETVGDFDNYWLLEVAKRQLRRDKGSYVYRVAAVASSPVPEGQRFTREQLESDEAFYEAEQVLKSEFGEPRTEEAWADVYGFIVEAVLDKLSAAPVSVGDEDGGQAQQLPLATLPVQYGEQKPGSADPMPPERREEYAKRIHDASKATREKPYPVGGVTVASEDTRERIANAICESMTMRELDEFAEGTQNEYLRAADAVLAVVGSSPVGEERRELAHLGCRTTADVFLVGDQDGICARCKQPAEAYRAALEELRKAGRALYPAASEVENAGDFDVAPLGCSIGWLKALDTYHAVLGEVSPSQQDRYRCVAEEDMEVE